MIDKPLYQNPLGGGLGQIIPNPGAGNVPRGGAQDVDPIMQGFQDSEFRKNANMMQQDVVNFKYKGQDMMMNGSMSGAFKQYLDSIGKGDLYEGTAGLLEPLASLPQPTEGVSQDVFGNPNYLDGTTSVNPIVSDPSSAIASINGPGLLEGPPVFRTPGLPPPEAPSPDTIVSPLQTVQGPEDTLNPYNRVGQQLTGPNQDDILGTLKNIEQGIASLGQGGMNQSSFGGFNNNFGIGSFFPPYGGMYGQ